MSTSNSKKNDNKNVKALFSVVWNVYGMLVKVMIWILLFVIFGCVMRKEGWKIYDLYQDV